MLRSRAFSRNRRIFRPRALRRAAIIKISISRPVVFRKQGKKRRVLHFVVPHQENQWSIVTAGSAAVAAGPDQRGAAVGVALLRGRLSGRSEAHAETASLNSARSSSRGTRMRAHRCKFEGCRAHVGSLSSLMRQQASLSSVRPFSCDGRMIAHDISRSSLMCRVLCNLEWSDQARGTASASIAFPQQLLRLFSPAAKRRHSSRKTKKPSQLSYALLRA